MASFRGPDYFNPARTLEAAPSGLPRRSTSMRRRVCVSAGITLAQIATRMQQLTTVRKASRARAPDSPVPGEHTDV